MLKIMCLAMKNLLRYKRRTFLTGMLIAVGEVAMIVFVGLSGSFKRAIVGQITDSVLSHLQVHRKGYMASIDNLPLDRMMPAKTFKKLSGVLNQADGVTAFSPRVKFGAMLSNYAQTTNVRLNGVDPAKEQAVVPLLAARIKDAAHKDALLKKGEVLLPEVLAKGMGVKTGDTIVLVANNKDGSVNGMTFKVAGVVESLMGPGGRDGYLHIEDATALLRMETLEVSEVAVRTKDFEQLGAVSERLRDILEPITNKQNKPIFELHTWDQLTPFYNVVRMIDVMTLGIKVIGLFIAVAVSEVFEAQTFSNFFRFPMIFLCGLFFPIEKLPVFLRPLSYALPLTYGVDVLHGAVHGKHAMPFYLDLLILGAFCVGLFALSLRNIQRRWIF